MTPFFKNRHSFNKMKKAFETIIAYLTVFSLSTFAFASINLGNICLDAQIAIAEYLENPFATLGFLNKYTHNNLSINCTFKYLVDQRFGISELAEVSRNQPELIYLLSLSFFAKNRYQVFQCLYEDVINRQKRYDILYAPLVSYLARIFNDFTPEQKAIYHGRRFSSFEDRLVDHYQRKGDYKSAFEAISQNPIEIVSWYFDESGNSDIYKMFMENPHLAECLKAALNLIDNRYDNFVSGTQMIIHWVFRCIWYNLPESYYLEFLAQDPNLLKRILKYFNILSNEVCKSELPRIHSQYKKLVLTFIDEDEGKFLNLLVDIRYGPEKFEALNLVEYNGRQIHRIEEASIVGQKRGIFSQIFNYYKPISAETGSLVQVLTILEIFNLESEQGKRSILSRPDYYKSFIKYYAINGIKLINDRLIVDIIAPESLLLSFNIAPFLSFNLKITENIFYNYFVIEGPNNLWSTMKIIDEGTFFSFLSDYEKLPFQSKQIETSFEVVKLIISSPILIEKIKEIGIKLSFSAFYFHFLEFLDLIKSTEGLNQIFDLTAFQQHPLLFLCDKNQLKKFEQISEMTIAEIFLNQDDGSMTENDYFIWRSLLAYWINGDQRQRISEISSPVIIHFLRMEFFDEMIELVGNSKAL